MSNFLKTVTDSLSSVFHKDTVDSVLGIDIGSSSVKIVQLKKHGGKAVLETYGALSLGPYANADIGALTNLPTDVLAKALIDVLKESNTTTTNGALAIPSIASLIFIITLPGNIKESDLANIIPVEARKYVPVPIAEVTLDWWMLPNEALIQDESVGSNQTTPQTAQNLPNNINTEVLVVAIHNDTLAKYRELLTASNINSHFFEMEIFSAIRSSFNYELAPVVFIDFGASKTKVTIIEYGIVKSFHIINRGSYDITKNISTSLSIPFKEAEDLKRSVGMSSNANQNVAQIVQISIDYILAESYAIVLAYQKKYNKAISKVIMMGGGSQTLGLKDKVSEVFFVEVMYADPFTKTEAPAFLEPILKQSGPEFAVAIGLALRQLS
ncbi:type IV pilus assembly protein PilM [Candidatus Nomurabacteria bacterium]|nr:type IV pilus assembly protein PilM [Candidatus Nomurabacteria bacterium]